MRRANRPTATGVRQAQYLNHADLRDTTRTEDTDLTDAKMHFAHLEGADLGGARRGSASGGSLTNATYDDETRKPKAPGGWKGSAGSSRASAREVAPRRTGHACARRHAGPQDPFEPDPETAQHTLLS